MSCPVCTGVSASQSVASSTISRDLPHLHHSRRTAQKRNTQHHSQYRINCRARGAPLGTDLGARAVCFPSKALQARCSYNEGISSKHTTVCPSYSHTTHSLTAMARHRHIIPGLESASKALSRPGKAIALGQVRFAAESDLCAAAMTLKESDHEHPTRTSPEQINDMIVDCRHNRSECPQGAQSQTSRTLRAGQAG